MPRISKIEMDRWLVSGSWKDLEKRAAQIVFDAEASAGSGRLSPLLGGGTRLMLELSHRIRHLHLHPGRSDLARSRGHRRRQGA